LESAIPAVRHKALTVLVLLVDLPPLRFHKYGGVPRLLTLIHHGTCESETAQGLKLLARLVPLAEVRQQLLSSGLCSHLMRLLNQHYGSFGRDVLHVLCVLYTAEPSLKGEALTCGIIPHLVTLMRKPDADSLALVDVLATDQRAMDEMLRFDIPAEVIHLSDVFSATLGMEPVEDAKEAAEEQWWARWLEHQAVSGPPVMGLRHCVSIMRVLASSAASSAQLLTGLRTLARVVRCVDSLSCSSALVCLRALAERHRDHQAWFEIGVLETLVEAATRFADTQQDHLENRRDAMAALAHLCRAEQLPQVLHRCGVLVPIRRWLDSNCEELRNSALQCCKALACVSSAVAQDMIPILPSLVRTMFLTVADPMATAAGLLLLDHCSRWPAMQGTLCKLGVIERMSGLLWRDPNQLPNGAKKSAASCLLRLASVDSSVAESVHKCGLIPIIIDWVGTSELRNTACSLLAQICADRACLSALPPQHVLLRTLANAISTWAVDRDEIEGCLRLTGVLAKARPTVLQPIAARISSALLPILHHGSTRSRISAFHLAGALVSKSNSKRFSVEAMPIMRVAAAMLRTELAALVERYSDGRSVRHSLALNSDCHNHLELVSACALVIGRAAAAGIEKGFVVESGLLPTLIELMKYSLGFNAAGSKIFETMFLHACNALLALSHLGTVWHSARPQRSLPLLHRSARARLCSCA
jgi:hypothetical protein